jgi:hypothetical protein
VTSYRYSLVTAKSFRLLQASSPPVQIGRIQRFIGYAGYEVARSGALVHYWQLAPFHLAGASDLVCFFHYPPSPTSGAWNVSLRITRGSVLLPQGCIPRSR